jgi:hypothetical protein
LLQYRKLNFECLVLLHLALHEAAGQRCLFGNPVWRQQVSIVKNALVLAEVFNLDQALGDQGL